MPRHADGAINHQFQRLKYVQNISEPVIEPAILEWQNVIDSTPLHVREKVRLHVSANIDRLVEKYVDRGQTDPDAFAFFAVAGGKADAEAAIRIWMLGLWADSDSLDERVAQQRLAGQSLARGHYPLQSVARGARKLRAWLLSDLRLERLSADELLLAASYISDLLDISIELRSVSYMQDAARQNRTDEAYRMHALGQNIAMERERQRAALMEWGHTVLVDLHRTTGAPLPRLSQSEFGLWLSHRAATLFEGAREVTLIGESVERIDGKLLPGLETFEARDGEYTIRVLEQLQAELGAIKFSLTGLFEQQIEVENGRDTLTRLLNRRFLSSVLTREIALHRRSGYGSFSVLLLDLDHFKKVNDVHGHDAGDAVLQQAAALVVSCVRPSDFVFRYGGEEILVVLVESQAATGMKVAEDIRARFAATRFAISDAVAISATVSIGVANYTGRPDYQHMLTQADEALYRAKSAGRNRVELAVST